MTPRFVEQVFLSKSGGGSEVLLVLEDEAGGRSRQRLPLPDSTLSEAARIAARQLARRGVTAAAKIRLRVGSGQELRDDADLLSLFLAELAEEGSSP